MKVTVEKFYPESGVPGQPIEIYGSGFITGTRVWFFADVEARSVTVDSDDQLTAIVPAGARTGVIKVRNANGESTTAYSFTVDNPAVRITSFTPGQGQASTQVTIAGVGFSGGQSVRFGSVQATQVTWQSDTSIIATVPSGIARNSRVPIQVTSAAGSATSTTTFLVV